MNDPTLFVFSGLPGTGKSTLARELADTFGAIYLRIDSVEDAIRESRLAPTDIMDAGYRALWSMAVDNLTLGRSVVADSVNPTAATRNGWRNAGHRASATLVEIEVVCSDPAVHEQRVTRRHADGQGPSWEAVQSRHYVPRSSPRIIVDTARDTPEDLLAHLVCDIEELG